MGKTNTAWLIIVILIIVVALILFKVFKSQSSPISIEPGYTIPEGFTVYSNRPLGLSAFAYPNDWNVMKGRDEYEIAFVSPNREASVSIEQLYLEQGEKLNYETYLTRLLSEDPSVQFEKTNEQIKNINGKDWLLFGGRLTIGSVSRQVQYGIYITSDPSGRQFYRFLLDSTKDRIASDTALFTTMLESARFFE